MKKACFILGVIMVSCSSPTGPATVQLPAVRQSGDVVVLWNELVSFEFNVARGTYRILDKKNNEVPIRDAALKINKWSTRGKDLKRFWEERPITNELGKGKALDLTITGPDRPTMLFTVTLHKNQGFLTLSGGIRNTTDKALRLKEIHFLADGKLYRDYDLTENFAMVDGYSGGEPLEYGKRMYSPLTRNNALRTRNNLALTFGKGPTRRSLVMGGLTYHDYEKFASIAQPRKVELEKGKDGKSSLLCYLDLPSQKQDKGKGKEVLKLLRGNKERTWHYHEFRCRETATAGHDPKGVILEASGLDPWKSYSIGFSWWRGFWHGNHGDHWQSVFVEFDKAGETQSIPLLENHRLPRFDSQRKEGVEQVEIPLPATAVNNKSLRVVFKSMNKASKDKKPDPNAYVGEVWLRDGASAALLPSKLIPIAKCPRPRRRYTAQLYAKDPVGRLVDPGKKYLPKDRFYLNVTTACPFTALEQYGRRVRQAQKIDLSMYDFPTVCLWYAENTQYGKCEGENTTVGAVNETKKIAKTGFLNYSRAAVRLVPDTYHPNNQQGWFDDEHWQMEVVPHNPGQNGRHIEPYETTEKWGKAVTKLGGIPLTYFQTCYRSEDYAKAFPGHMLFNKTYAWKGAPGDPNSELFTSWKHCWRRNGRVVWGYDYTDPDFLAHMKEVYENLKAGGIKGLMFDYPASGWARAGGMEDTYSTTAAAYRTIFRLPHEGLGPNSYVHERNMERGTDISIGLVASMRTENDTDRFDATTTARCGMRWYKNRVLYNQDTDSKNLVRLEKNRDHVRAVLTMAYVTTGRLLLANSFSQFSPETLRDITRTFPYHTQSKSARPADAFVAKNGIPTVYDYEVTPEWHQVTFFNPSASKPGTVGIDLAGEPVEGALGLDAKKTFHVFDFWNHAYVGKVSGKSRLEQELRPGEARMMSVRACRKTPQILSTNRHVMQGFLDIVRHAWLPEKSLLIGTCKVVGKDPYVVTIATNGYKPMKVDTFKDDTKATLRSLKNGLVELTVETAENRTAQWQITWERP